MPRALSRDGRFLARGGRLVPNTPDCIARCCGGSCLTAWQFTPCPPPTLIEGSNPGANPDTSDCADTNKPAIYICADAVCGATPIGQVTRVLYAGFCYTRGTLTQTSQIPPGSPLVDASAVTCLEASIGCDHPLCVAGYGRKFVPGVPCPGQVGVPSPVPYFLACLVDACDVINYQGICYLVSPGAGVDEVDVPAGAPRVAVGVTGTNGGKCCECVPGCVPVMQSYQPCDGSTLREYECCCSARRTVRLSKYEGFFTSPPFGGPVRIDWSATEGVWEYDDNGTLTSQTGGVVTVVERFQDNTTNTYTFTPAPWAACGFPGDLYQGPTLPALGGTFTGCDNEAHFEPMTVSAFKFYGCESALLDGTWTVPVGDGSQQQQWHALIIWWAEYDGRCGRKCPEAVGEAARGSVVTSRKSGGKGCASCGDKATGGATI